MRQRRLPRHDSLYPNTRSSCSKHFQLHPPNFLSFTFSSRTPQEEHLRLSSNNREFRHKEPQIGRSSDNRRFCSPHYSAWRRSRTESLLSNARYFINSPPCARFARALGAPRTAHFATPPLGAGAVWLLLCWRTSHCCVARFVRPRRRGFLLSCSGNRSK